MLGEPPATEAGSARDSVEVENRLLKPLLGGEVGADGSFHFDHAVGRNAPAGGGDGFPEDPDPRLSLSLTSGRSTTCWLGDLPGVLGFHPG